MRKKGETKEKNNTIQLYVTG